MRKYLWLAYALPLLSLFAIEAAFFAGPWSTWRPIAGFFWMVFAAVVLLSAGVASLLPFCRREFWGAPGRGWYLLAFFGVPFLVLFGAGGIRFCTVDTEGLQQLAAGVGLLRTDSASARSPSSVSIETCTRVRLTARSARWWLAR